MAACEFEEVFGFPTSFKQIAHRCAMHAWWDFGSAAFSAASCAVCSEAFFAAIGPAVLGAFVYGVFGRHMIENYVGTWR